MLKFINKLIGIFNLCILKTTKFRITSSYGFGNTHINPLPPKPETKYILINKKTFIKKQTKLFKEILNKYKT
jgi:hypothetical protein